MIITRLLACCIFQISCVVKYRVRRLKMVLFLREFLFFFATLTCHSDTDRSYNRVRGLWQRNAGSDTG